MRALAMAAGLAVSAGVAEADRALVVGIDDYDAVAGASRLTGAVADAGRIEALLVERLGFAAGDIVVLTDGRASYDAILTSLIDHLISGTTAGDRVVLYFAGHGTTTRDGQPALVAHDGDSVLGRIPLTTLDEMLGVIPDRDITVILDTGFHGGGAGTRGFGSDAPTGPVVLSSVDMGWIASDGALPAAETPGAGLLTAALAEGVSGAADADGDGGISGGELTRFAETHMGEACAALDSCAEVAFVSLGRDDATVARMPASPVSEVDLSPLLPDDGAPAGYMETLGFVTDLFAPSNDARLTLSIVGGEALTVGETVTFSATSERAGALLLLDVDPTGALSQIYPSVLSPAEGSRIEPGAPLRIPNAVGASGAPLLMRVTEPAGQGVLLGVFIEGDLEDLTPLLPAGLDGGGVSNASQSLFELSQTLLARAADPDAPVAWSATYLPYRIHAK
ncbi:DUF4384 domain-containing protein [Alphaproteobacteria bacterium GH1-50]|uniref:DUF4384 domain-containing protein n=1 Tax=Kangsaoukella pontilimi TaxID=2691042 RepID=A0A7C9IKN3_9RHOB|nr:caspase family protein [Kangsaoukella pontilimi]MXQ09742.1 DUF4384 domain-containing protein [Kangsaoukella pontilimi]